jgi:hypothetical protein
MCVTVGRAAAFFALLAGSPAQAESKSCVSVNKMSYKPNEKIMKIDINVSGGEIIGVPYIFPGWSVTVTNDDSYRSEFSGLATVGGDFISPKK